MAIADIPGAFLQTDMVQGDFTVRDMLYGVLADLLVKIDPSKFSNKFFLEGGKKVIYAVLKNPYMVPLLRDYSYSKTCPAHYNIGVSRQTHIIAAS